MGCSAESGDHFTEDGLVPESGGGNYFTVSFGNSILNILGPKGFKHSTLAFIDPYI